MILLYPELSESDDVADILARVRWYLRAPMSEGVDVVFGSSEPIKSIKLPSYIQTSRDGPLPRLEGRERIAVLARQSDVVVVAWNKAALFSAPATIRQKALAADEVCDTGAAEAWMAAVPPVGDHSVGKERFQQFTRKLRDLDRPALILGSGPTLPTAAGELCPEETINIYAASALDNESILSVRPPHLVAIPDIAAQSGPSMTAARRRDRLFKVMRENPQTHVLVPEVVWRCLNAWWPDDLSDRVFYVPADRTRPMGKAFSDVYTAEPTGNVLTGWLLPAAAAVSKRIIFVGIDGTSDDGGEAWTHDREELHQSDLLEATLAHWRIHVPDLADYYEGVWARAAAECDALERAGWDINRPSPIKNMAHQSSLQALVRRRWLREQATRFFGALAKIQDRPMVAVLLGAVYGAFGGAVYGWGMVGAIFIGAFAGTVFATAYFSLRRRMDRRLAFDDRYRSTAEERVLKALAARVDVLEKQVAEQLGEPDPAAHNEDQPG